MLAAMMAYRLVGVLGVVVLDTWLLALLVIGLGTLGALLLVMGATVGERPRPRPEYPPVVLRLPEPELRTQQEINDALWANRS